MLRLLWYIFKWWSATMIVGVVAIFLSPGLAIREGWKEWKEEIE